MKRKVRPQYIYLFIPSDISLFIYPKWISSTLILMVHHKETSVKQLKFTVT